MLSEKLRTALDNLLPDAGSDESYLLHGEPLRDAAVLISPREYDRLRGLNVAEFMDFCDRIGARAKKKGLTSAKLSRLLEA